MESSEPNTSFVPQIFYGNPRLDQIPGVQDDFQTIFYTADQISPAELKFIEPRLHGIARQDTSVGRVFFEVPSSGRFVIAQIAKTNESDRSHRPQFLAHALLMDREHFSRFANNPFVVFASFAFLSDFDQLISFAEEIQGNVEYEQMPDATRWVPPAKCENKWNPSPTPEFWENMAPETILKLFILAERASQNPTTTLGVVGGQDQIRLTLAELIKVISPDQRLRCSFDTLFCNASETRLNTCPYWAVGIIPNWRPIIRHNFAFFSVDLKTFSTGVDLAPISTCERWLANVLSSPNGWQWLGEISLIRSASDWWDGNTDELPNLPPTLIYLNEPYWRQHIESHLNQFFQGNSPSAIPIWTDVLIQKGKVTNNLRLWRQINVEGVTQVLANHYWEKQQRPTDQELDCIRQWVTTFQQQYPTSHLFRMACIYCRWKTQWETLVQFLRKLSLEERGEIVQWVLHSLKPNAAAKFETAFQSSFANTLAELYELDSESRAITDSLLNAAKELNESPNQQAESDSSILGRITRWVTSAGRLLGFDK